MPRVCSFGCAPSGTSMHGFPNPDKYPERFKTWVTLVGGKLETESDFEFYKRKKVCDIHFTNEHRNRFRRLNALAIPTLHLPATAQASLEINPGLSESVNINNYANQPSSSKASHSAAAQASLEINPGLSESVNINNFANQPSSSKASHSDGRLSTFNTLLAEHNYTVASRNKPELSGKSFKKSPNLNCSQLKNMRTQIKHLRNELSRIKKNGKLETRLANATKVLEKTAFQQVVQRMAKPAQLFINMQLQGSKKPKGRRFSIEEKVMCLSMFKKGPKCYALLSKYFTLPSAKAMKRLLSQIKLHPGINPIIFEKIKKTLSEKDVEDRLCSLSFDEMSLEAQVHYNAQKDSLEGFACNRKDEFANHALVFMVKSIKQTFKQPIAYYFTNSLKKGELKQLIKEVIRHAYDSGLIIVNTVCDQSTVNVSAITELVNENRVAFIRKEKEWRYDCFSVDGKQIIPLYDAPHIIKGIRNNLLTKDMLYTTNGKEKKVKWEYYQNVYNADKSYGNLRLLHKLTEDHLDPAKINKMRVKTATQIFSHSVAVVTEHLTGRGDLPEECRDLIDITLLLNNVFDSLNVSSFVIPDGKIYKGAVRNNSSHHKLWSDAKHILKTVKFVQKKIDGNKIRFIETTVPSITNLIKTIEGIEALWKVLSKKYRFDAMLTRNFNQDPVENFFGNIRSYGIRNTRPNTVSFEGAFKALLLTNYSTPHSNKANCEEDKSDCLQNLDFFLKEDSSFIKDVPNMAEEEENIVINEEILEIQNQPQEDAGQRNYVCGWVLTKCLKNICKSCQQCRQTMLENKENTKNDYIKTKEYKNKKWLCYPSEETANCFYEIQMVTTNFLKRNVPKKNVKKNIINLCNLLIEHPFKCSVHKEIIKQYFLNVTVNVILYSWCRTINRILAGKITYKGDEEIKKKAMLYYNRYKNYQNKK